MSKSTHQNSEDAADQASGNLTPSGQSLLLNGLWRNNPGLVQLLGLCPLLAVSNTLINGFALGLATLLTLMISNLLVSTLRHWITTEIRIPVYVLIIASTVTAIELVMRAWLTELYVVLGIFIPLIVTNCMIIGRAESFASRQPIRHTLVDGAAQGMGFLWVLSLLGGFREFVGHGTLLRDAQLMFGPNAASWTIGISDQYQGILLALLPPGAFISLGLLLVGHTMIDNAIKSFSTSATQRQTLSSNTQVNQHDIQSKS